MNPATARLRSEAFKALEARLALRVDLAAVEGLAFVAITHDLVSGVKLGESRRRLRIRLVGVGVQFFREAPIRTLDIGLARTLGNPQNLVGVAHLIQTPVNPLARRNAGSLINVGFRRGGCKPSHPAHPRASGNLRAPP